MDNPTVAEEILDEAVNNNVTNAAINTEPLPSQYLQNYDNIFSLGGQEFRLNSSGTKRLIVGIASREMPQLKVIFKMHDVKNGWCIQFSKKSWDAIMYHSDSIIAYMEEGVCDEIFDDRRIQIATSFFYNRFCVVFTDRSETRVVMMPETFNTMVNFREEVNHAHEELCNNIKDVTKRMKLFMDLSFFHLFKSNNVDCRHNYNWLAVFMNRNNNFLKLNNSIANTWSQLGKWIETEQDVQVAAEASVDDGSVQQQEQVQANAEVPVNDGFVHQEQEGFIESVENDALFELVAQQVEELQNITTENTGNCA